MSQRRVRHPDPRPHRLRAAVGYLRGGFESWQNEGRPLGRFDTADTAGLRERLHREELAVRRTSEWAL